jgi:hypothetical protein
MKKVSCRYRSIDKKSNAAVHRRSLDYSKQAIAGDGTSPLPYRLVICLVVRHSRQKVLIETMPTRNTTYRRRDVLLRKCSSSIRLLTPSQGRQATEPVADCPDSSNQKQTHWQVQPVTKRRL